MIKESKIVGIDLFAGAGGMSLGAKLAGVNVKFAVEANPSAALTYNHNHPETTLFNDDIRKLKQLPPFSPKAITVLFGGPPCQGFSTSNQKTRKFDNSNNWLFEEYIRIAKLIKPDWIVFENVTGMIETEKGYFLEMVSNNMQEIGYQLSIHILNALNYGVPQSRKRLFIIGSKHGISVKIPPCKTQKPVTLREALSDLPKLPNGANQNWKKYRFLAQKGFAKKMRGTVKMSPNHLVTKNSDYVLERYGHIPQGGNWESIPKRLMKNYADASRCHTGIYRRLDYEAPSMVIGNFRKNMLIHPTQNRGLSVREAARIQSFPDNYEFMGNIGAQQQQVGDAVPPLMARIIFDSILPIQ